MEVRYRMRKYALSAKVALRDNPEKKIDPPDGLELTVSLVNSEEQQYAFRIENISEHTVFVFPQASRVAKTWSRKDGILLPYEDSYRGKEPNELGVVYLFPGDLMVRPFRLHSTVSSAQYRTVHSDPTMPPREGGYTFINGLCVGLGDEDVALKMSAFIPPFSEEQQRSLKEKLFKRYLRKASTFHILESKAQSRPLEVSVSKGSLTK
jgi:hypothetical protein